MIIAKYIFVFLQRPFKLANKKLQNVEVWNKENIEMKNSNQLQLENK